jgi:hypothetical protein
MLSWLGGIGLGLVWGWLIILIMGRGSSVQSSLVKFLSVATATIVLLLQQFFQGNWQSALFFTGGAIGAGVIHFKWLSFVGQTKY